MRFIIISVLIILATACNKNKEEKIKNNHINYSSYSNENISFAYDILDTVRYISHYDSVPQHAMKIKCIITNNSDTTISYLGRTCGEIVYSLEIIPSSYKVDKDFHCNASWYSLSNLKAKESFDFETTIVSEGDSINLQKVGIMFIKTVKGFPHDTLRNSTDQDALLDQIIIGGKNSVNQKNIIWSSN
ncbi:hypothetical protein [Bernardetia sp.]|uniref:hypothetical protein n=1 Tax=Bernardetia sp. TaxID=1937974 RepID=UPI0025BD3D9C|nr:hypothetical protein [Bernardetia sp.]